jgi:DNA helicase-2/ATP-dependent DNA helicase PcrA
MTTKYTIQHAFDPHALKVDYRKELNHEQHAVVTNGDGYVLVLAGAGSGKTRTIVYRVAYLLERGVPPEHILLVTFTNKAAKEMLFRVERLLGQYPKGLWGGTFHHVANLLLRKHARAIGYAPNFTILDDEDSRSLIGVIIKELNIESKKQRFPSPAVVQDLLSLVQNTERSLADIVEERRPEFLNALGSLEAIQREYTHRKKRNNSMDFDDLLVQLLRVLRDHPAERKKLSRQFRYILVDEYQDTNRLQASIVQLLAEHHKNLLVVGDDAQSIYSFRGADIGNILEFPKRFSKSTTMSLTRNYRSTQPILDCANAVITNNPEQFPKTLIHVREGDVRPALVPAASPKQEAEFVAQKILELRDEGVSLNDIAVLFRATHQSQTLEFELTKRDIPYEYRGGVRFFERAHIKDVLAHLKILDNPTDEVSWLRVLTLQVGIGAQTAADCVEKIRAARGLPSSLPALALPLPKRAMVGWQRLQRTFATLLGKSARQDPSALVSAVANGEYREYLANQYPNADERLADLEQLALFAKQYRALRPFLAEVSLQEAFAVQGGSPAVADDEAVVLSTIHQAKGLEWDAVFCIHLIEPGFPNARAMAEEGGLSEERRLFYVAITRAMTKLFLCYPIASDYQLLSLRLHEPSRFLRELDTTLLEEYELTDADAPREDEQVVHLDDPAV